MVRIGLVKPKPLKAETFTKADLVKIGAKLIDSVQKRCERGQDANDSKMKPLSKGYAEKKAKMGQPAIRNMMFSGSMLGAMTITKASDDQVTIGFTRQAELVKAQKNQDRSNWFGISPSDEDKTLYYAGRLLESKSK